MLKKLYSWICFPKIDESKDNYKLNDLIDLNLFIQPISYIEKHDININKKLIFTQTLPIENIKNDISVQTIPYFKNYSNISNNQNFSFDDSTLKLSNFENKVTYENDFEINSKLIFENSEISKNIIEKVPKNNKNNYKFIFHSNTIQNEEKKKKQFLDNPEISFQKISKSNLSIKEKEIEKENLEEIPFSLLYK